MGIMPALLQSFQVVGLNGFRYRIQPRFPQLRYTTHFPRTLNWNKFNTNWLDLSLTMPTVLFGFSDGATAALQMKSKHIKLILAHSPLHPGTKPNAPVVLFRTIGDRTPTFNATGQYAKETGYPLIDLDSVHFTLPITPIERVLFRLNHQFHNADQLIRKYCDDLHENLS